MVERRSPKPCVAGSTPARPVDIFKTMITKVQNFIGEVMAEMKKVSWVTRQELWDSTLIVVGASLLLGLFVAGVDFVLSKGVAHLLR